MITRSSTTYYTLPEDFTKGKKTKDAKCSISLSLVMPKELERRAHKFMAEQAERCSKEFDKFMKKELKRIRNNEEQ